MSEEITLMKGNEAIAHAAIRYGTDGYFGYPITRKRSSCNQYGVWRGIVRKSINDLIIESRYES